MVHARGAAARGVFRGYGTAGEVCRAAFLADGVEAPVFVRFSTVLGSRGSADTVRDTRGFATKFYTTGACSTSSATTSRCQLGPAGTAGLGWAASSDRGWPGRPAVLLTELFLESGPLDREWAGPVVGLNGHIDGPPGDRAVRRTTISAHNGQSSSPATADWRPVSGPRQEPRPAGGEAGRAVPDTQWIARVTTSQDGSTMEDP